MLNETVILQHLNAAGFNKPIHIHVLESVDSTNRFLKDLPASNAIEVCCAETQTSGRGRFGRSWDSPFGQNIYCSIRWHFDCDLSQLSGLSLVVSMAILSILQPIDNDIRIKWPNDLLWHGKKLCGCLIESMGCSDVVIGIGLNVNAKNLHWGSLHEITGQHFDRNTLISQLLIQLDKHLKQFIMQGLTSFISTWQQVDYLYGQWVVVSQPAGHLSGRAMGIDALGQLRLTDEAGVMHYLASGDTSLKV